MCVMCMHVRVCVLECILPLLYSFVLCMIGLLRGMGERLIFKVVILGEGCVGKTSIVLRYIENKFDPDHKQTLQVCACVHVCACVCVRARVCVHVCVY